MALLTDWVRNIVLVVLFASFLELLLPSSGMQRFVRVIMGLMILLTILNPVLDLLQNRPAGEIPALGGQGGPVPDNIRSGTEELLRGRDRLTADIYKKELARHIRAVVTGIDGVADARVAVELGPNGGKAGALGKVTVYVQPGAAADDRRTGRIKIGGDAAPGELRPALRERVVRAVCELYQLPAERVEVSRMQ